MVDVHFLTGTETTGFNLHINGEGAGADTTGRFAFFVFTRLPSFLPTGKAFVPHLSDPEGGVLRFCSCRAGPLLVQGTDQGRFYWKMVFL